MIELAQKALSFNPRQARYYNAWGDGERQLGHLDKALEAYHHSIECSPQYTYGYDHSAEILTEQGRPTEAAAMHDQAEALRAQGKAERTAAEKEGIYAPTTAPATRP
jgi:tetratricopeptide (TPR) repeat protein